VTGCVAHDTMWTEPAHARTIAASLAPDLILAVLVVPLVGLYSGSNISGGSPYAHTGPTPPSAAVSPAAAFNAGLLMSDAHGGYFTDGETILPLRQGAGSFVVRENGTSTVGQWGL
jgi:hypothetical protein